MYIFNPIEILGAGEIYAGRSHGAHLAVRLQGKEARMIGL